MSLPEPVLGPERPTDGPLVDRFARAHDYLRVSVTERCSLRCTYCVPESGLPAMPAKDVLTYEEIVRVVRVMRGLGVRRVRLTGGEPLLRRDIVVLVRLIAELGLDDLAMTTNGLALPRLAADLAAAGLRRVNISLDSLDPVVFRRMTGGGDVRRVLDGVAAALDAGLTPVKINAVAVAGENDADLVDLVTWAAAWPSRVVVRFIEHMPFGSERRRHLPVAELRRRIGERFTLTALGEGPGGPAVRWRVEETGQELGFISPITEHFCHRCNRLRLDADGHLRTCLSRDDAPSLRDVMRSGIDDDALAQVVRGMVWAKVPGHEAEALGGRAFEGVMTWIGG